MPPGLHLRRPLRIYSDSTSMGRLILNVLLSFAQLEREVTGERNRDKIAAIIQSILAMQQPRCMSLLWFQRHPLLIDWVAQREVLTKFDA